MLKDDSLSPPRWHSILNFPRTPKGHFPQPWPHIFAPGEPKLLNDLSLAEFCATSTAIIQLPESLPKRAASPVFLSFDKHSFHSKVLNSIELGGVH